MSSSLQPIGNGKIKCESYDIEMSSSRPTLKMDGGTGIYANRSGSNEVLGANTKRPDELGRGKSHEEQNDDGDVKVLAQRSHQVVCVRGKDSGK